MGQGDSQDNSGAEAGIEPRLALMLAGLGSGLGLILALPFVVRDGPSGETLLLALLALLLGGAAGLLLGRWLRRRMMQCRSALRSEFEFRHREEVARARALLTNAERVAQLGSAERDLRTGLSAWSDEFHVLLGLVPGRCTPSQSLFLDSLHPADRSAVEAALDAMTRDGGRMEETFRILRPDGETRVLLGRAVVECDRDGRPIRLDATIQDISERKRLEDELDGLIRELWRSNEELEQFAYVASHDLRQPLRVVSSYVSLMEEELQGELKGETLEYMAFVRDGVRRMDRLITDLLTYSRVGRTAADQPVVMARAIDSAMTDLQFEIEESGAVIRIIGEPPVVLGDEGEMERLFLNLIGNAIKYRRPDHPPEIRITVDDIGDAWRIALSDNGIGIPPEHAERVFGIFQRLHARNEFEGTGVGLAIVKKIVERHGGTIMVEPSEAAGTTLVFTWPKRHINADAS
jgi:signal transduction histidine kinase